MSKRPPTSSETAAGERIAPRRKSSRHGVVHPPSWRTFAVIGAATIAASVYLFATAPPPLAAAPRDRGTLPMRAVFSVLEVENDAARALWTTDIVKHGQAAGLAFQESWREQGVAAGPLPALFLRETARNLERSSLQLSLFLGSSHPINAANLFTGQQSDRFAALAASGAPQFFYEPATQRQTAMFSDLAIADGCVTCHNEHKDSPKTDWKLGDLMGATTWMYPEETVSAARALEMVATLRGSIRAAYEGYLAKAKTFPRPPQIGERWPKDGYYLPTADVFMRELERRTSSATLRGLTDPAAAEAAAAADPVAAVTHATLPATAPTAPAPAPAAAPAPAVAPAPAAVATPPAPAAAPTGLSTVMFRTEKPLRVAVDHANARVLVAKLPAGGVTSLAAKLPLKVKLSELAGVEITLDGVAVDLSQIPRPERDQDVVFAIGDDRPAPAVETR